MKKVKMIFIVGLLLIGFVVSRPVTLKAADEGKTMKMGAEQMPAMGNTADTSADIKKPEVAIEGNCPVCMSEGMEMKGKDEFTTEYKGKIYRFESQEHKDLFLADPEKYVKDLDAQYKEEESKEDDEKKEVAPVMMNGMK